MEEQNLKQVQETKVCKHCQSEIPKKAKVCPNCRKKQGGKLKFVIIALVAIVIIASIMNGGGNDSPSDSNPKKVNQSDSSDNEKNNEKEEEEKEDEKDLTIIFRDLEERMKQVMGTKVIINKRDRNKGKIEIEYYSEAELERLVELIESIH